MCVNIRALGVAVVLSGFAMVSRASAQDAPPVAASPPERPPAPSNAEALPPPVLVLEDRTARIGGGENVRTWYGWQTLMTDGASLLIGVTSIGTANAAMAGVGVATYELGAPIVHWAHGNVGTGFGSLGVRVLAPFAAVGGAYLGLVGAYGGNAGLAVVGAIFMLGALVVPPVVDAAVLAYDTGPAVSSNQREMRIVPSFAPTKHGAEVGLAGVF